MKTKVCSVGECMVEIINDKDNSYFQSYAGDTFNFSVYLSRLKFKVDYLTAVGKDEFSKKFVKFAENENISSKLIHIDNNKIIGLHIVRSKKNGEKKFFYWRDNSAAKKFFNNLDSKYIISKLKSYQYIYFSGITLSLIEDKHQKLFYRIINTLKRHNIKVIFDINIRKPRWKNSSTLNKTLNDYLPLVDILFATGEDMLQWKNNNSLSKFTKIIHTNKIQHAIYRLNEEKNYVFINNKIYKSNNKRHKTIVNSAGAGDGFNAHYIATFFKTNNVNLALKQGHNVGSKIVKHRSAIIP